MIRFVCLLVGLITINISSAQDVLMQGWYWDYPKTANGYNWADTITSKASELGNSGISHVWLPPLSRASFGSGSNGYDPQDLYDLGEFGQGATGYGTRAQVDASIAALNAVGVKAVADVVYNHRDGGAPEVNPSVEGWIENYNCTKVNNGDAPFPSDRYRCILPLGGSSGNWEGTYYFKIRSASLHPNFYNAGYKFYAETQTTGYQGLPIGSEDESSGNGGADCGQGNNSIQLGVDYLANLDDVGGCGNFCGIDEFALTINASDINPAGDTLYIYMNNTGGYSDHYIHGLWNGEDSQSEIRYETYTDFTQMPSGQGLMNYTNFRPNGNPTSLSGDWDGMWFFYDYDQSQTSTQDALIDWSKWLYDDVNIEGYRMDAVKHFPPSFIGNLVDQLDANGQSPEIMVGEFFDTNPYTLKAWSDAANGAVTSGNNVQVFDFALRQALKNASDLFGYDVRNVFNSGIVRGAQGNNNHVITFLNNHDYRHGDEPILNDPILGYAYMIANPELGIPTVFYSDFYGVPNANAPTVALKEEISRLIDIRKRYTYGSNFVDYLSNFGSPYPIYYVGGDKSTTTLAFQTNNGGPDNDVGALVVINYAGEELDAFVTVKTSGSLPNGTEVRDVTGKSSIPRQRVTNNEIHVKVPPRSYVVYVSDPSSGDCSAGSVMYVDKNANGLNNGSSWKDAYINLQGALNVANTCSSVKEIWIKEGEYLPHTVSDRSAGFEVRGGLEIYGGFETSGNPDFGDRNYQLYPTLISGDVGQYGDNSDNVYHVITTINGIDSTIIDGVDIIKGRASGSAAMDKVGAGIYNQIPLVLKDVKIIFSNAENEGRGIYNANEESQLILNNVTTSSNDGGSSDLFNNGGSVKVTKTSNLKG